MIIDIVLLAVAGVLYWAWRTRDPQAMRDYLANNRADRYGKFEYSTDLIDADIEALHAEFAPYRQRFGCEIERKRQYQGHRMGTLPHE